MSDEVAREPVTGHETDGTEDRIRSVVKDCVHCGFCLPACPTYSLWGEEMDSPRGRIYLVSQLLDGAPLTPAAGEPGGWLPAARRPLRDRLTRAGIFALFPYPDRLRVATAPLRLLQKT